MQYLRSKRYRTHQVHLTIDNSSQLLRSIDLSFLTKHPLHGANHNVHDTFPCVHSVNMGLRGTGIGSEGNNVIQKQTHVLLEPLRSHDLDKFMVRLKSCEIIEEHEILDIRNASKSREVPCCNINSTQAVTG